MAPGGACSSLWIAARGAFSRRCRNSNADVAAQACESCPGSTDRPATVSTNPGAAIGAGRLSCAKKRAVVMSGVRPEDGAIGAGRSRAPGIFCEWGGFRHLSPNAPSAAWSGIVVRDRCGQSQKGYAADRARQASHAGVYPGRG